MLKHNDRSVSIVSGAACSRTSRWSLDSLFGKLTYRRRELEGGKAGRGRQRGAGLPGGTMTQSIVVQVHCSVPALATPGATVPGVGAPTTCRRGASAA